jgi:hypothetical protein
VPQKKDHGEAQCQDAANEEVSADGPADEESRVDAEGLNKEASKRVEAHVEQEDIAALQTVREAAGNPKQYQAD